jgi:hypothetical protein
MSRLDSVIRRLRAQRACLDMAKGLIAGNPGPVLELGLGNGRTFDHLRSLFPDREIFVFDRQVAAHPDCIPDDGHLILGDIRETLPPALSRIGTPAALAHADIGTGDQAVNAEIAAFLSRALPGLMAPDAIVLADRPLAMAGWREHGLPSGVRRGRYFVYRRT